MTKLLDAWRFIAITVVAFSAAFLLAPRASAGIIGVANATGPCSPDGLTNGGGTICSDNTTAFSLTAIEDGSVSLLAVVGTQTAPVYLVDNDTGSSTFTLTLTGDIAFNQFITCQENGGFAGDSCSITGALGTVGTGAQYGPPSGLSNGTYWDPDATITFTDVPAGDFDLTFASFGNGDTPSVTGTMPEPSSLALLATGLFGLVGFARRRLSS
jgi:PEP-CTERM motif